MVMTPAPRKNWWRIWLIGTVAWAAWTFWTSNPRCLIINGDRWCYYGSDFEYYAWLLIQMFGWPVLIWHTSSCIALGYLLVRGSTSALEGTLPSLRFPPLAR